MKRHIIIGLIIIFIFCVNMFAAADIFSKHDFHNKLCSLHEHQHVHHTLKHTHSHNHKVNPVDFYIADTAQIEPSYYMQENNFDFVKLHHSFISKELFRPPIV